MRSPRHLIGWAALWLAVAAPAWGQISASGFSQRQCGAADPLFRAGFEVAEQSGNRASGGAGGPFPGPNSLTVTVPDTGRSHQVYLRLPPAYSEGVAWSLVLVLHGAAGSPQAADAQAAWLRDAWATAGEQLPAVVAVPVASGASGGWVPSLDTPALPCIVAAIERQYSIDRRRRYLWGFSAGAHFGHAVALANADRFAAYAVKAGALAAFACNPAGGAAGCATSLPGVSRRIPVQLRVGESDSLRAHSEADALRFADAGWPMPTRELAVAAGGHAILFDDPEAAARWFAEWQLP